MSYNGSGSFSINSTGQPVVDGTDITAAVHNALTADLATGLSTAICKDGQTTPTANIPLGGFKLTGVGAATARTDAASLATIQDGSGVYVATVGGTADVITLTVSPAITSYVAGQEFWWIASGANTTNVTVNVSGLGAKALTKDGTTALVANDILSGALIGGRYDGTRFQLLARRSISAAETLTNKTIALGSNTVSGTTAQFNTALSDNDFATLAGTETLTNKTIALGSNTISGTTAQFNTALTDNDFATLAGTETLTNKTLSGAVFTGASSGTLALTNSGTNYISAISTGNYAGFIASGAAGSGTDYVFQSAGTTRAQFSSDSSGDVTVYNSASGGITEKLRISANGFIKHTGAIGRGAPVTKTASFTLADTENWIICNSASTITITFPAASSWTGREVYIKQLEAGGTVVSASSNVVPPATATAGTAILPGTTSGQYYWVTLVSNGTNWVVMQGNIP